MSVASDREPNSIEFNPASAKVSIDGDDFLFTLEDGTRVVLQGLVSAAQGEDAPMVQVAGINIEADVLIDEALRLPVEDGFIDTAGHEDGDGEDVMSGGGSDYGEPTFRDLIASPTAMSFREGQVCLEGEKNDRMAFQARADYQNHAIGWLQWGYSSLGGGKVVQFRGIWMASGECWLIQTGDRPNSWQTLQKCTKFS